MADFKAIKAHVRMLDVLSRYRIELRKQNGYSYKGKCPLPTHTSEADTQTFIVNTNIEGWVCHSSSCVAARNTKSRDGRGLKKGGDVIEFVQHMERVASLRLAGERLENWFGPFADPGSSGTPASEVAFEQVDEEAARNAPLTFELQGIDPAHAYLASRGFDEEECGYLGVGYFPGKGSMSGRIVFPVHDDNGRLLAYVGRSTNPDCKHDERWRFPSGFFKSIEVYNLHRVDGDDVIVVEGFWGVLACIRAGIFNVVAVMGRDVSDVQAEVLAHRFRRVTLMLDGDEYGREAIGKAVGKLVMAEVEIIDLCLLPKGAQPDSVSPEDLRRFLRLTDMPCAWSMIEDTATA
ncbi:MAG TPA: toprim domain-containing protein [Thermoanaerobaculia bacterium]|jgi:DNA primase|nr:toprim domain-containing protein [Thermoanaerobaculia bacterium]